MTIGVIIVDRLLKFNMQASIYAVRKTVKNIAMSLETRKCSRKRLLLKPWTQISETCVNCKLMFCWTVEVVQPLFRLKFRTTCTVLYCTVLYCTRHIAIVPVNWCSVERSRWSNHFLDENLRATCTIMYCTVLYCTVLKTIPIVPINDKH